MAYYPTLNSSDTADLQTIMTFVNVATGNIFWPIILLVIWIIWVLGATFSGRPFYRALLFASFFCSILSILMVLMNWLSPNFMYFLFFLTAVGLIWTRLSESYS